MESNGYTHAEEAKLLPYGMTDFNRIMTANYYYVDKTMFIPQVERTTSFFFFVRPRRFGKSLFLNMLSQYYDRNKADQFEDLFGSLWIGKHPTDDRNVRTDYNKLRHLIKVDKEFGENAGIIQELLINGGTTARINSGFSVHEMAKPDNFKSLLYYFGMLSIEKMKEGDVYLTIPNQVVREQIYGYMSDVYNEAYQCNLDLDQLNALMKNFAYRGEWRPYFDYVASQLRAQSSIREFMDGEAHVKAFLLSYMGLNRYCITYPEYEMNYGFSDFYLQPDLALLPDLPYSYVIEIKYAKRDSDDSVLDVLLNEAPRTVGTLRCKRDGATHQRRYAIAEDCRALQRLGVGTGRRSVTWLPFTKKGDTMG